MGYQHGEDGTFVLTQMEAIDLATLLTNARGWPLQPQDLVDQLSNAARALMPFPPAEEGS